MAIGAPYNDGNNTNSGHVRVYNLQRNVGPIIGWNNINGATSPTLSLSSLTAANDGEQYRFVATANTIIGEALSVESQPAELSILTVP
jgi:hypothetical protein